MRFDMADITSNLPCQYKIVSDSKKNPYVTILSFTEVVDNHPKELGKWKSRTSTLNLSLWDVCWMNKEFFNIFCMLSRIQSSILFSWLEEAFSKVTGTPISYCNINQVYWWRRLRPDTHWGKETHAGKVVLVWLSKTFKNRRRKEFFLCTTYVGWYTLW